MSSGVFLSFEGIDGAGKSSHVEALAQAFRDAGRTVVLTREPGGTPLAEQLRALALNAPMDPLTEALLMFAARLDHGLQVVAARREHEQRLGQRVHRRVQRQPAQLLGQRRAARFAREDDGAAGVAERLRERVDVAGLAGAVDAFEAEEQAAAHRPLWYLFTARLCSSSVSLNWLLPSPRETK